MELINKHITIDDSTIEEAIKDYEEIASHLIKKLNLPQTAVKVISQGSARTKTLIRTPDRTKFDIDAVCAVDFNEISGNDPMSFFYKIGEALEKYEPEQKKRCWKVDISGREYYIEFTPSIPLGQVPSPTLENVIFSPVDTFQDKALAVVDTPSETWKTSNPEGFADWVSEQANISILKMLSVESMRDSIDFSSSIEDIPDQDVPLSDTLRIAIRLLKRHRDMSIRRGLIDSDLKPISIIIVTLLTQCYKGLADMSMRYQDPIRLLIELVELMPFMIEERHGEYWIANPTVDGENFAEKWNDNIKLKMSFDYWTKLLIDDLHAIMMESNEQKRSKKLREVFGCYDTYDSDFIHKSGLASQKPKSVGIVPATKGLS